jgi:pimeloyl-ACP methyl ester carboxylesterase
MKGRTIMPTVPAGNARVHYLVDGSGPGLALIHGTAFGAEGTWAHLVEQFATDRTVIRPNFAGSDETVDDGGEITIEALVEQVAAAIEDVGATPVDLVGFSLGAVVAAAVAATRPELVRRLVLTAGWSHPNDEYRRNLMTVWRRLEHDAEAFGRFATMTAFSQAFLNAIGREEVDRIALSGRPTPGALRQIEFNLRVDIRDLLPRIQAQTLVIGCGRDNTVPVENARELHRAIAGSGYAEIDSGHVVLFEHPAEFVKLVKDFIDKP